MNSLDAGILTSFPSVDEARLDTLLKEELAKSPCKLIVLDDDPTGVQTVHDISVYTDWSADSIRHGFAEQNKLFYILTNSRSMTAAETAKIHREIAETAASVSKETKTPYLILSRSDSTLRGHYPLETEVLKEYMEQAGSSVDGEILCFFFKEGGRFTIHNTHYVRQGDQLIPAALTEFAKDPTFGYTHSSIPDYIEEKTDGRYRADSVICISMEALRSMDFERIEAELLRAGGFRKICVNAVDYCDLKVFVIALYRAMAKGKHFMFRTAAGLVKIMGGISDIPLLTAKDLALIQGTASNTNGGMVVVGSHTHKTTKQLNELLKLKCTVPVKFHSEKVLDGDIAFYTEVNRCVKEAENVIRSGKTAVCFTQRTLLTQKNDTRQSALLRSVKISDGVQNLVARLKIRPSYLIAKGGITSSDIGTKALAVKQARVMGQIRPGIPVWQTGPESRFPDLPYIIFPGNTGDNDTLKLIVEALSKEALS